MLLADVLLLVANSNLSAPGAVAGQAGQGLLDNCAALPGSPPGRKSRAQQRSRAE